MDAPVDPLPNERWLPVPGFEGLYAVSSMGRVFSHERVHPTLGRRGGRLLRCNLTKYGYWKVDLKADGKRSSQQVHRLVARAFLGEPEAGQMVRHLNGLRSDNRLENLAWGTGSENAYDSIAHGTHPMASKTRCKRGHPYEGDNLAIDRRGRRVCLACERARNAAAARRAAEKKVSRPKAPRVATDLHIQPADGGGATLTIHALGADGRDRVTAFALDSQLVNLLRQVGAA